MKSHLYAATSLTLVLSISALSQTPATSSAAGPAQQLPVKASNRATVQANYGKLALSFEANQGQSDPQVKFLSRGQGYSLFLTDSAAVLALTKGNPSSKKLDPRSPAAKPPKSETAKNDVLRMELAGANPGLRVSGAGQLPGKTNYFIGNDPSKWRSNLPTYAKVKYTAVYPGVDLVYYGNQRQLEYDFVVAPGADPRPVKLHFAGASKLKLNANGGLTIIARNGEIAFHKPVVYQTKDGQRQPVDGSFELLAGNRIAFNVGDYDHTRELVIDPTLAYSTYLGGTSYNQANAIAVDENGNAYVAGYTGSIDFPVTEGAYQTVNKARGFEGTPLNVFVTELNPAGSALIYSTYLGGSVTDEPYGIQVDGTGSAYLAGRTRSPDFPVTSGAFQTAKETSLSIDGGFVTKLSPSGSALVYSTYLGVSGETFEEAIAVDAAGHAFVTGWAYSVDFPVTSGAFQQVANGTNAGFVTEFNTTGSGLVYSTYLGGSSGGDVPGAIAVDSLDDAYIAGYATSTDFPVTSDAFQKVNEAPTINGFHGHNGFITELNASGSALVYSTYLGGSGGLDFANGLAVDGAGSAYVTGETDSTDFPITSNAFQKVNKIDGNTTAFVTKLNPTGSGLVYSTYLGGSEYDLASGIAVDPSGNAYVAGQTASTDFPITPDAYQPENGGTYNAFFTKLDPTGSSLLYSTYLGGGLPFNGDYAQCIALDSSGNAYLAGTAESSDFPVAPGAFQPVNRAMGAGSAFISKFAFNGATTTSLTSSDNPQTGGESVAFNAHVAPVGGSSVPAGAVSFIVDGVITDHETLDGSGDTSFSTSALTAGPHTIVASYLGEPTVSSASSGALTQTITGQIAAPTFFPLGGTYKGPHSVVLETASPGATIYYATGSTVPTTSSAMYTGPISISATTTINAIAVEAGDTQSPVASATYTILPPAIATTTSIQSSLNPSVSGQSVTFTATVAAASGPTPTGSVTFKHGSTIMGSAPLVAGVAQFTTSSFTPEGYEVLAVYTGNTTDADSYSPAIVQVVNP